MTFVLTYAAIAIITTLCLTLLITAIGSAVERVAIARVVAGADDEDDEEPGESSIGSWHPSRD